VLVGVVLGRRRRFTRRETAIAGLLGPQLGAAVDHVRLRTAQRAVAQGGRVLTMLSGREREVLAHVADGRTNREIAEALHIEARTVEKHVEHIRTKLGARSRAEAAARWARATA
jgi:DNA-binding NarL/FixJ family response regulator